MVYYHDILTTKIWEELKRVNGQLDFALIGGWAVYLYIKALKSKDIDILLNYGGLDKLRLLYPQEDPYLMFKNGTASLPI